MGTQLIVQEGQAALFVCGGVVADVFYQGTHTLSTDNIPILKKLINLPFGGTTPFSAEIYFINTTVKLDINWGTSEPIQLIDPKYHVKLRVRAFGQMGVRILDAATFFKEVIGGMQKDDIVKVDKVKKYYRRILVVKVKSVIADTIITNKISALEITTKLEELSDKLEEQILPEFKNTVLRLLISLFSPLISRTRILRKLIRFLKITQLLKSWVMRASMNQTIGNPIYKEEMKECVSCHAKIPAGSKFCPECGFNNSGIICECGNKLAPGTKFCPECGKKVQ